jgi:hypothetical protein
VIDFMNLKIKLIQFFIDVYRVRIHIHIFIEVNTYMYISIFEFLKKEMSNCVCVEAWQKNEHFAGLAG